MFFDLEQRNKVKGCMHVAVIIRCCYGDGLHVGGGRDIPF